MSYTLVTMDNLLIRTVGLSASYITGSINSEYRKSELWTSLSCEHYSNELMISPCQKCEECICRKCKDFHKRVSIPYSDEPLARSKPLGLLKATKAKSLNVKLPDDPHDCWITGIAVLRNGPLLVADFENRKLKMFSQNTSSLYLRFRPWDITIFREEQAAVSQSGRQIALVDISEAGMALQATVKLGFDVYGISACGDKLIVTSICHKNTQTAPSVKMIDIVGKVYWSVPMSNKEKQVFKLPMYVRVFNKDRLPTAIVTDSGNSSITLLDAETGEIINKGLLPWSKEPQSVTVDDQNNNIYLSYIGTNELVVMTENLSGAQVLLSRRSVIGRWFQESEGPMELEGRPWAIAFDPQLQHLIISYDNRNRLDFYHVTKMT